MSDAGWNALAQMGVALCAALAAIFARAAGQKAEQAAQEARATNLQARETKERLITHEAASESRGQALMAEIAVVPGRPPSPSFHPGGEGTVPSSQQGSTPEVTEG